VGIRPLARAVFLDRDGVLNRITIKNGVPRPPRLLSELAMLPGAAKACARLHEAGYTLVVVTNQPDVARGTAKRERVEAINNRLAAGLPVAGVMTCYHDGPDACACRKPRPGMLLEAAKRWRIELGKSFMVGDRWSDVAAGQAAGCRSILIKKRYSEARRCRPDWAADDLAEAAGIILSQKPI
jgi:D-glycero-D-manno-heptose 1,7-bisphosphate phosphatase